MRRILYRNRAMLTAGVVALTSLLFGCGGGEPEAPAEIQAPQVDPRFASAEALLDHYNELTVRSRVVDPHAVTDLLHAENDVQRRMVGIVKDMIPFMELQHAVWERFGEGLSPTDEVSPLSPNQQPARITEHAGQRAEALETEPDGTQSTLHLVQIGDRWWLSGYTLEYDPRFAEGIDKLDVLERNVRALSAMSSTLTPGVRSGQFASIEEVRLALGRPPT